MSRKTKTWLIIAASLIGLGCILFGGAMTVLNWDFTKLGTMKYETNSHSLEEAIIDINIATKTADVIIRPSGEEEISVVCYEQTRAKHTVAIKDGVLEIRMVDERKWYDYIGINFRSPRITVSIPRGQYGKISLRTDTGKVTIPADFGFAEMEITVSTGNVTCAASVSGEMKIKSTTGSIHLQELSADTLDISTSTGKITAQKVTCAGAASLKISTGDINLMDLRCKSLTASGDTSDILLKDVIVEENMSVETDTGKVKFDRCDAGEMQIKTDTGSVTGSLLTPKIFFAETDTGKVDVPKSTYGGKCEITTDTGDIRITVTE